MTSLDYWTPNRHTDTKTGNAHGLRAIIQKVKWSTLREARGFTNFLPTAYCLSGQVGPSNHNRQSISQWNRYYFTSGGKKIKFQNHQITSMCILISALKLKIISQWTRVLVDAWNSTSNYATRKSREQFLILEWGVKKLKSTITSSNQPKTMLLELFIFVKYLYPSDMIYGCGYSDILIW